MMCANNRQTPEQVENPTFWQNNGLQRLDLVDVYTAKSIFTRFAVVIEIKVDIQTEVGGGTLDIDNSA